MQDRPIIKRRLFKTILVIISALSIIVVLAAILLMPFLVDYYQDLYNKVLGYDVVIFLWISGVPVLIILIYFLKLSLSLLKDNVFMSKSVKQVSAVQICLLIEILLYIYAALQYRTIIAIVVLFGTILCEVFASVARELLIDGTEYYIDSTHSI